MDRESSSDSYGSSVCGLGAGTGGFGAAAFGLVAFHLGDGGLVAGAGAGAGGSAAFGLAAFHLGDGGLVAGAGAGGGDGAGSAAFGLGACRLGEAGFAAGAGAGVGAGAGASFGKLPHFPFSSFLHVMVSSGGLSSAFFDRKFVLQCYRKKMCTKVTATKIGLL